MLRFLTYTFGPLFLPVVALAQAPSDFRGFVALLLDLINGIIGFVLAILFVVVIWGIINGWVIHGADEKGVESGKNVLVAGIIAFVVIVGFWGIVAIIKSSFFG